MRSRSQRKELASQLYSTFSASDEQPNLRICAYYGILAAQRVPPLEQPPVSRKLNLLKDVDPTVVEGFRSAYLSE